MTLRIVRNLRTIPASTKEQNIFSISKQIFAVNVVFKISANTNNYLQTAFCFILLFMVRNR